jgi:hypothetical protein
VKHTILSAQAPEKGRQDCLPYLWGTLIVTNKQTALLRQLALSNGSMTP